jgi:hypothetical protein
MQGSAVPVRKTTLHLQKQPGQAAQKGRELQSKLLLVKKKAIYLVKLS